MKKSVSISPLAKRHLKQMGDNIKMARLRRNLSIRAIAQRAGLSVNTVMTLERGGAGVSIGAIANVLHSLGIADHVSLIAQSDLLGRKLQDLELTTTKKSASKKSKTIQASKGTNNETN
ncbi:MAG: helix-turn-helix domain-containing protein [Pseudobdellovibrionaceae bacterium]